LELPLNHPYENFRFADVPPDERLLAEYQVLGFATSGHPFALLAESLPPDLVRCDRLEELDHGATVQIAGLVVARQRPETAKGFTFVLLEDETGMMNVIVRPDVYERDRIVVRSEPFLWILGELAKDDGTVNIIATEIRPLNVRHPQLQPAEARHAANPYRFLRSLRQNAPGSKDWG